MLPNSPEQALRRLRLSLPESTTSKMPGRCSTRRALMLTRSHQRSRASSSAPLCARRSLPAAVLQPAAQRQPPEAKHSRRFSRGVQKPKVLFLCTGHSRTQPPLAEQTKKNLQSFAKSETRSKPESSKSSARWAPHTIGDG